MRTVRIVLAISAVVAIGCESREQARLRAAKEMMKQVQLAMDQYDQSHPGPRDEPEAGAGEAPGPEVEPSPLPSPADAGGMEGDRPAGDPISESGSGPGP